MSDTSKICIHCQTPFESMRWGQKYCSKECRAAHNGEPLKSAHQKMSPGTSGALSELRVCADLLIQGFEVFRAVSPSCSCDLMIRAKNCYLAIEVRTAYTTHTGTVVYSKKHIRADHIAAAFPDKIEYYPSLPEPVQ